MSRITAALLAVGVVAIVAGVALMHVPTALIVGGVLSIAAAVLVLELPGRGGDA